MQFFDFLAESGASAPVSCVGNPDLYVICKENGSRAAVGFFNCFADPIDDLLADISFNAKKARFYRCKGSIADGKIRIEHLSAYDWCFVEIEK